MPDALLGHNGGNAKFFHKVSHPSPVLAAAAGCVPGLMELHAASLGCTELSSMRLLRNHFIRTDPAPSVSVGDGIRWHIDNAFLPSHEDPYRLDGGPREVYTRSIVALNTVETGGAALMVSPGSVGVKASLIISVLFNGTAELPLFPLQFHQEIVIK